MDTRAIKADENESISNPVMEQIFNMSNVNYSFLWFSNG